MDQIGRYRILGELGRGGMGVVYRGEDVDIGRPVAIKTLHPEAANAEFATAANETRDRLRREAQAIGTLSHPNIVMVYDLGQHEGAAYIVMELIEGSTLDRRLESGPAMSPSEALQILYQIASALDYAHGRGVVHRDIKPANVLIQTNGQAKIADFGIAKLTSSNTKTSTGMVVGSANYMAPEQLRAQPVGGYTDQFALAVIAYQMVTGAKPFDADTLAALVTKILFQEPASPQNFNTSLGPAVESVLRRGLAKEPSARYATCTEFVREMDMALGMARTMPLPAMSGPPSRSTSNPIPYAEATVRIPTTPPPIVPPPPAVPTAAGPPPLSGPMPLMGQPDAPLRTAPVPFPPATKPVTGPQQLPPIPPPPAAPSLVYAGFMRRIFATLIDGLILWIVMLPFSDTRNSESEVGSLFLYTFLLLWISAIYETALIKVYGATLGKRMLGLRVVTADGSPLTWQIAFARYVGKSLNYLTLFLSTFMILFDKERRALQDRICNTRVVRV